MKLLLITLLTVLSYHSSNGYPAVEGELSTDLLLENATSIEYWYDASNDTAPNDSLPLDMHGFGQKVKDGIKTAKDGFNKVKDKAKNVYDKVKDKVKDKIDNFKDKIKDFKDKIGSKGGSGGGSGGGYYRDKYDRDRYNRDYDRDRDYYRRDGSYGGGSGSTDPNAKWIVLGIVGFFVAGVLVFLSYYKIKGDI